MTEKHSRHRHERTGVSPLYYLVMLLPALAACSPTSTPNASLMATMEQGMKNLHAQQTQDVATLRALLPTPTSTPRPPEPFYGTRIQGCGRVAEGGSVIQALQDGYNHNLPPVRDEDERLIEVSVDHRGVRSIASLMRILAMNPAPIVEAGDQVCFSNNPTWLRNIPTPTPKPTGYNPESVSPATIHHRFPANPAVANLQRRRG